MISLPAPAVSLFCLCKIRAVISSQISSTFTGDVVNLPPLHFSSCIFWCPACQSFRILGQSKVSNNRGFCSFNRQVAITLVVFLCKHLHLSTHLSTMSLTPLLSLVTRTSTTKCKQMYCRNDVVLLLYTKRQCQWCDITSDNQSLTFSVNEP